jgi:hypothetical protein
MITEKTCKERSTYVSQELRVVELDDRTADQVCAGREIDNSRIDGT